jgi:hypothetical protein
MQVSSKNSNLLNFFWFNTPQLVAEYWVCEGFVPPTYSKERFQEEIFYTLDIALF